MSILVAIKSEKHEFFFKKDSPFPFCVLIEIKVRSSARFIKVCLLTDFYVSVALLIICLGSQIYIYM